MRNEKVWLRTLLMTVVFIGAGGSLLVLAASEKRVSIQGLLASIGALLVTFGLGLIWELARKESLLNEWAHSRQEREQIEAAGVVGAATDPYQGVPWPELFAEGSELEVFVAYGHSWRTMNYQLLNTFLSKGKAQLHVALVDHTDHEVVAQLARRYSKPEQSVREAIHEACVFFADLGDKHPGKVRIHLARRAPLFAIYKFQTRAVLRIFNHRHLKDHNLAVIVRSGGFLYSFLEKEMDFLLGRPPNAMTRQIYPAPASALTALGTPAPLPPPSEPGPQSTGEREAPRS